MRQCCLAMATLACLSMTPRAFPVAQNGDEFEACCDCSCGCGSHDLWNRAKLTGDWWGYRSGVAQSGLNVDVRATQFYQGVTNGGANETFRYGGKADYFLTYSGQQAGLSGLGEGLIVQLHAETRFGQDINRDAVTLAPSDANMLYPNENQVTAITGLTITQALSEEWAVQIGKFNAFDMFQQLYPQSGRGLDGFMNASMVFPLSIGRTVPLSYQGDCAMLGNLLRVGRGDSVFGQIVCWPTFRRPTGLLPCLPRIPHFACETTSAS